MKPIFDYRFFAFLSEIETLNGRRLFRVIAKLLKYRIVIILLYLIEKILSFILVLPIPIYSQLVYLTVKNLTGFLGYYLRGLYYSFKAKKWGGNIIVDEDVIFENISNYEIGEFVQIDKRVIIGCDELRIGNGVHIAMGVIIGKGGRLVMEDYSGISYGSILICASESPNSGCRTGSMIPYKERSIKRSYIILGKESLVYSGCILLPKTIIHDGGVASAGLIVKDMIPAWKINFNNGLKNRNKIS